MSVDSKEFDDLKARVKTLEESLNYLLIEAEEEDEEIDQFEEAHRRFSAKVIRAKDRA